MKVKIKTKLILILFTESYFMLRRKQQFSKYNVHVPLLLNCFAKTYNNEKVLYLLAEQLTVIAK